MEEISEIKIFIYMEEMNDLKPREDFHQSSWELTDI